MAKFKRRTFNRKRFPARKRTFRKRTTRFRRQPLPRYDGMVRIKMQAFKELNNTDVSGISSMLVDWGDQRNAPVADIIRLQDSIEWTRYKNLYRFFRI